MINISEKKSGIVLVGRNYCNLLTMARALGESGYNIEILRVFKSKPKKINLFSSMKPEAYSKYVKNFQICIVNMTPEKVVESLIQLCDQEYKKLLLPVDDYTACIVDEHLELLKDHYYVPNIANTEGEISKLMNKYVQKERAVKSSLPVLRSTLIKSKNGIFDIPEDIVYPCFVKPNISMKSTKSKMVICEDGNELFRVLNAYAQKEDFEMLVEEYADIKSEYSLLGVSTKSGTIAPGVFKVCEGGHKERKGVAITGEIINSDPFKSIIDKCIVFVESLKYTGIFDIDLIETKDGKLYFIELNFRPGASIQVFTPAGMNMPKMFADFMIKEIPIDLKCDVKEVGKRFVSEKVLMEEFVRNDVNIRGVWKKMKNADVFFIKDKNDPKPYRHFKKYFIAAVFMRVPYYIRDHMKERI